MQVGEMRGVADICVGTDIESIDDVRETVERHGARYLRRLFTDHEIESCGGLDANPITSAPGLAARFAAKEATIKLLGPTTTVPRWKDIEVRRAPSGQVDLHLTGTAAELARHRGIVSHDVSLSHGAGVGLATVIGLRVDPQEGER
jgi:holo-[acyl-carrier protein] synthase